MIVVIATVETQDLEELAWEETRRLRVFGTLAWSFRSEEG